LLERTRCPLKGQSAVGHGIRAANRVFPPINCIAATVNGNRSSRLKSPRPSATVKYDRLDQGTSGSRPRPVSAVAANDVWAYDFVFDACANGQQLKCLTVIDEHTRESLAIDVAGSIRSGRLIEVLTRLVSHHGAPKYLRSDNGPEFVSKAVLKWLLESNIDTALIDPGKPWQNGADESFNGKFRDECLSLEWFRNRTEAKIVIENWRRHYNEVRPHSSLSYQTPVEFKSKRSSTNPGPFPSNERSEETRQVSMARLTLTFAR
jgi:putative transposase